MLKGIVNGAKNLLNLDRTYSDTFTLDEAKWYIGATTTTTSDPERASVSINGNTVLVTSLINGFGACFMIPVEQMTSYSISMNTSKQSSGSYFAYAFLNESGSILYSNTSASTSTTISTYSGTKYLNLCLRFPAADGEVTYSNIMVNKGSQPLPYEPYQTIHDITRIPMRSKNLFDKSTVHEGYYISDTNGAESTSSQYSSESNASDYIPISGDYVSIYSSIVGKWRWGAFYDSSKTYISGISGYNKTIAIPQNAAYMRLTVVDDILDTLMVNLGSTALPYVPYGMVEGWEVRDQQGRIIWGADKTLTGTDSITYKGYGLDIKEYSIDGNMVQAAEKEYSITGTSPLDFQSNGSNATISISGNETQASNQAYTTSGTSPLSFNADGTNLTALSMDGNMNQASSQPYTVSGTSPISFMNNGTAIDYTVSGNMNQTGTPTPTSPITPQECGERTANLVPPVSEWYEGFITSDGTVVKDSNFSVRLEMTSDYIEVPDSSYVTFSYPDGFPVGTSGAWRCIAFYQSDKTFIQRYSGTGNTERAESIPQNASYIRVSYRTYGETQSPMLNSGSTALPYEPYGYKIPITNGSTTYNIYLSEPLRKIGDYSDIVNSDGSVTRVIKKNMLYGTEDWVQNGSYTQYSIYITPALVTDSVIMTSSHFVGTTAGNIGLDGKISPSANGNKVMISHAASANPEEFKQWLASEYAAGHPVEVWYVLATAQTDTATVPTITPTSGNNTLSVDTTLSPSNITITSNSSVFPGNPITPIECGVKTENLTNQEHITSTGYYAIITSGDLLSKILSLEADEEYSLSWDYRSNSGESSTGLKNTIVICNSSYASIKNISNGSSFSLTATEISNVFGIIGYFGNGCTDGEMSNIMLNSGSTALPYEPYGKYKIPITVGSTTNNIFINQPIRKIGNYSDSIGSDGVVTRNIKKLVLTGQESWQISDSWKKTNTSVFYFNSTDIIHISTDYVVFCMSESFEATTRNGLYNGDSDMISRTGTGAITIRISDTIATTDSGFKTWLSDKYSAGTPVEVWYVLATPDTTETTTIPTISTVNGSNTLTTGTPITPSNITISTSSSVYPKNPIYPEECGDRTINLFNPTSTPYATSKYINDSGAETTNSGYNISYYVEVEPETDYRLSGMNPTSGSNPSVCFYNSNKQYISGSKYSESNSKSFTTPANTKYIKLSYATSATEIMLKQGSASEPYEPYGYKIPVTIGSNTNYIYTQEPIRKIGDYSDVVNSDGSITRKILQKVLDGKEGWSVEYTNMFVISTTMPAVGYNNLICSHYQMASSYAQLQLLDNACAASRRPGLFIKDIRFSTNTQLKAYLAEQYANGTPVTVWYPVETPTTEQTTIPTLTTVNGKNTATIGTTLAPSSITINATSKVYPNNPIIPEECGDLTENLGNLENGFIDPTTGADSSTGVYGVRTQYIACSGESTYTMSTTIYPYHSFVAFYDSSKTYLSRTSADLISSSRTFTTPSTASFMRVTLYYNGGSAIKPSETNDLNFMLNSGNTAKPYEPYGKYKVPIINNGVTKNIYLNQPIRKIGDYADIVRSDGTVERKIEKLVFDGTETTWGNPIGSGDKLRITMNMTSLSVGLCSHYPFGNAENPGEFDLAVGLYLRFNIVGIATTRDEWKAYLAAQYSAGHPVEVWYVLATPETESITTPTLTTIEGVNTIEVDTTLSPSKIDITGHIKYST